LTQNRSVPHEVRRPLLSFCIPTYNRCGYLEEALKAIIGQWESDIIPGDQDLVEVIVSDNASPDGTADLITRVTGAYPNFCLRHVRNQENRGPDANILQVLRLGNGEYVCLLSDDDILLPGALKAMLVLLCEHPTINAFCLNTSSFIHVPTEAAANPDFTVDIERVITDPSDCLRFIGSRITFISLLMFRRPPIAPPAYDSYVGSSLLQAYVYLDVLTGGRMYVTKQVFLGVRGNNTGGYSFYEVFVSHFADVMRYARSRGYSEAAVRAVLSQHLIRFLAPFTASFKLHGTYGKLQPDFRDGIRRLWMEYGTHPFFLFGVLPLMLAPPVLARVAHSIIHRLKSRAE